MINYCPECDVSVEINPRLVEMECVNCNTVLAVEYHGHDDYRPIYSLSKKEKEMPQPFMSYEDDLL